MNEKKKKKVNTNENGKIAFQCPRDLDSGR